MSKNENKNYRLDFDLTAPLPYAIWDVVNEDIVGAGETPEAAFNDARSRVKSWAVFQDMCEAEIALADSASLRIADAKDPVQAGVE